MPTRWFKISALTLKLEPKFSLFVFRRLLLEGDLYSPDVAAVVVIELYGWRQAGVPEFFCTVFVLVRPVVHVQLVRTPIANGTDVQRADHQLALHSQS